MKSLPVLLVGGFLCCDRGDPPRFVHKDDYRPKECPHPDLAKCSDCPAHGCPACTNTPEGDSDAS